MLEHAELTNEKLLSNFLSNRNNPAARACIFRRVAENSKIVESDYHLLQAITEKLEKMEEIDSDMIEESATYKKLCRECLELQGQLLQRMTGESPQSVGQTA